MSLLNHEARAVAVKILKEDELRSVHELEKKIGRYLIPSEVALKSQMLSNEGGTIKKWWGIPEADAAQSKYSDYVHAILTMFLREKKVSVDMMSDESRMCFDWQIFHSKLDFSYNDVRKSPVNEVSESQNIF